MDFANFDAQFDTLSIEIWTIMFAIGIHGDAVYSIDGFPASSPALAHCSQDSTWNAATSERKRGLPEGFRSPPPGQVMYKDLYKVSSSQLASPLGVPDDRELAFSRELVSYRHLRAEPLRYRCSARIAIEICMSVLVVLVLSLHRICPVLSHGSHAMRELPPHYFSIMRGMIKVAR
jgi:hypothetical protein